MTAHIVAASGSIPFSHALLPWLRDGSPRLTVVVKATFTLAPGALSTPEPSSPVIKADIHLGGAPHAPVALAAEMAPFLPNANVMLALVGASSFPAAARNAPWPIRLTLSNEDRVLIDKRLLVRCTESHPLPIYERATGGGTNAAVTSAVRGGSIPVAPGDVREGFGPIAASSPARAGYLRGVALVSQREEISLDGGFDYRFFNPAPIDQQVAFLRGGEILRLEGMHPTISSLVTRLPAPELNARRGTERLELALDMLVIDLARWNVALIWRGSFRRDDRSDPIEVSLRLGNSARLAIAPSIASAAPGGEAHADDADHTAFLPALTARKPALPFAASQEKGVADDAPKPAALPWESEFESRVVPSGLDVDETLPFLAGLALRPKLEPETVSAVVAPLPPAAVVAMPLPPAAVVAVPPSLQSETASEPDPLRRAVIERMASKQSLSGMDLAGAQLQKLDLSEQVFTGATLDRADLSGATLVGADLSGCSLERATLREADFSRANLDRADISKADLTRAKLTNASLLKATLERAVLDHARFDGARMSGARLRGATGVETNFNGAILDGADLRQVKLTKARFEGANLQRIDGVRADFAESQMKGADLSGANLRPAHLVGADLREAGLVGTDLRDADLSRARLKGARSEGAKLKGAILTGATTD